MHPMHILLPGTGEGLAIRVLAITELLLLRERRCVPLALSPLPLIFSYKSEKSLCGTGNLQTVIPFLGEPPLSRPSCWACK